MTPRLARAAAAAVAFLLFLPVLSAEFVYDDLLLFVDNPSIRSASTLWEAFEHPFWGMVPDPRHHGTAGFYRPLGTVLFVVLHALGGGEPWAYHLASLLLHAGCSALVASLALRLGWKPWAAAAAGVLFALHGSHVEAVAWASALTYLLATLFSLLALLALARRRTLVAAAWLLPALLSQELALATLLLAIGVVLVRAREPEPEGAEAEEPATPMRPRLAEVGLLLLPLAIAYPLRVMAFDWDPWAGLDRTVTTISYGAVFENGEFVRYDEGLERRENLGLSFSLLFEYLRFLVWPFPHEPFHALRLDERLGDAARWVPALLGLLLSVGGAGLWLLRARRSALLLVPFGLMFLALAPVLKTSSLGQFPFEERFVYLSSVGFCLLAAGLIAKLPKPAWAGLAFAALAVPNAWSAWSATGHWKSEESLYSWAVEASPDAMMSHNQLGRIRLEQAMQIPPGTGRREQLAVEALQIFQAGLDLDPDEVFISAVDREQGNVGLANALYVEGDLRGAEAAFRELLDRWPDSVEGNIGLGASLAAQGELLLFDNQRALAEPKLREAIEAFDRALALVESAAALAGKGACLGDLGDFEAAEPLLDRAFDLEPSNPEYATRLASLYAETGRLIFARRTFEEHIEAAPDSPIREEALRTIAALSQMPAQ